LQKYSQNDPQLSQQIIQNWKQIQILIDNYRQTKNPSWKDALIEKSEKSWQYSNQMVDLMQFEAEKKHTLFSNLYYILIVSFIVMMITLLIIFSIFRLKLEEQAKIDPLTKIYNRHVFYQQIQSKISSSKRYNYPLSIILFDIDFFKKINDTFGHDKGDEILISFAKLLQSQIRDEDILCRFGGEEFIIITPYIDTKAAKELAHRLKNSIEQEDFDIHGTLTASIGIATKQDEDTEKTLFKRADTALYISKENGRNRITAV
jgi:diguanylate cyclase (GGDEF)-like protein